MKKTIMAVLEETISIPLVVTEQGTIRIKGSRVSLDSIVHHFKLGATADNLQEQLKSNPNYQTASHDLRSRILRRWTVSQENSEATPTA